ncbi:MAG: ABC transporter ATP-binding protein [Candidatus Rokubacteria bacterium]|nr:ABC transporter ATP-binding protein [Candidatus Rokubacteria bacterium]
MTGTPAVRMRGITKRFLDVVANDGIDFELHQGEVCALLGENGAGKTTLMNILFGLVTPDAGAIEVWGEPVAFRSPAEAIARGIGMVHQHFTLVPPHTVLENVIVGTATSRGLLLDTAGARSRLRDLARLHGLEVDPDARVSQLSVGEQQRVEIIKALYRGARVLILDEPTAVLTPVEAQGLFKALRSLTRDGHAVIFISHKLREVMEVSDRVVILRGGRVVATRSTGATDPQELARLMVGREIHTPVRRPRPGAGPPILEIEDLTVANDGGLTAVDRLSVAVHGGEIVGLAGVSGNGQRELAEAIFGLRPVRGGRIRVGASDVTNQSPEEVIRRRVARVPEDRTAVGLLMELSLAENLILETYRAPRFRRGPFLRPGAVAEFADHLLAAYRVRAPHRSVPAKTLSGGNLQRLLLARALAQDPALLVVHQPTRGLDVAATEEVHGRLLELRDRGVAVLLISEDLDEVLALSDSASASSGHNHSRSGSRSCSRSSPCSWRWRCARSWSCGPEPT